VGTVLLGEESATSRLNDRRDCYAKGPMENLSKDREIVQRVAEALDGQTGVIDAARILLPLLRRLPGLPSEEDFNLIRATVSETDDLPLGRVREHWDPAVLARKDRETARCESLWRVQFRGACERIIESLDGPRFP